MSDRAVSIVGYMSFGSMYLSLTLLVDWLKSACPQSRLTVHNGGYRDSWHRLLRLRE
jgi:hypothetical protein